MGWRDFTEIAAWRRAHKLKMHTYTLLARSSFKQDYRYCEQLRQAAQSAPSNIAEGFGRFGNKEFAHFARIAKGSEVETMNHFIDAHDQGLLTTEELAECRYRVKVALRATIGLIRRLESTPDAPRPRPRPRRMPNEP